MSKLPSRQGDSRPRKPRESSNASLQQAINEHLGSRLHALRKQHGWSQTKLGEMIGVTFQQIQKYEQGKNKINLATVRRLGELFGFGVDEFLEGLPGAATGHVAGLAEPQEQFHPGANSRPTQEEVEELVRVYARIADPVARERLMAFLRTWPAQGD